MKTKQKTKSRLKNGKEVICYSEVDERYTAVVKCYTAVVICYTCFAFIKS